MNENNYVDGFSIGIFLQAQSTPFFIALVMTRSTAPHITKRMVFFIFPFLTPPQSLYDPLWIQASIEGQLFEVYNVGSVDVVEEPLLTEWSWGQTGWTIPWFWLFMPQLNH